MTDAYRYRPMESMLVSMVIFLSYTYAEKGVGALSRARD